MRWLGRNAGFFVPDYFRILTQYLHLLARLSYVSWRSILLLLIFITTIQRVDLPLLAKGKASDWTRQCGAPYRTNDIDAVSNGLTMGGAVGGYHYCIAPVNLRYNGIDVKKSYSGVVYMTGSIFRSSSEEAYAGHLAAIGLCCDYERRWGKHNPDFTIAADTHINNIVAIADVKDFHHTKKQKAMLAAGQTASIHRDPHPRIREKINAASKQFEGAKDYPCILILGSGGDSVPLPLFVMAAMLGDHTLSIPRPTAMTPEAGELQIIQSFGENGKMVNKSGEPMNTRISAIGLLSAIRPDEKRSGFDSKVKELADVYLATGTLGENKDRYLKACLELRAELTSKGYKLDDFEIQVDYVLNPLAAKPFPRQFLQKGYVTVWEYDLDSQIFDHTYDWLTNEDGGSHLLESSNEGSN